MSQQNLTPTRPAPPDEHAPPKKHRPEMSLTQIVGSALAAMTAAAVGSRLGVGGTIIGAAVASVVAAVGGSLYTASLRTTREKVKTTLVAGRPQRGTKVSVQTTSHDVPRTAVTAEAASISELPTAVSSPAIPSDTAQVREETWIPATSARKPLPWKRIGVSAVAAFALAALALTGVELLTGTALSGGDGTTISQVSNERGGRSRPAPADSTASPSEKASADSSTEPSADPTGDAPSTSASAQEPSAAPSEQPTTAPTTDPSTEPTTAPTTDPAPPTAADPSTGSGDTEGSGTSGGTDNGTDGGAESGNAAGTAGGS